MLYTPKVQFCEINLCISRAVPRIDKIFGNAILLHFLSILLLQSVWRLICRFLREGIFQHTWSDGVFQVEFTGSQPSCCICISASHLLFKCTCLEISLMCKSTFSMDLVNLSVVFQVFYILNQL